MLTSLQNHLFFSYSTKDLIQLGPQPGQILLRLPDAFPTHVRDGIATSCSP